MGSSSSVPSGGYRSRPPKPTHRPPVRNVPLKVLCLGLPRTALREALKALGYADVYHFVTTFREQPNDAALWCKLLKQKKANQQVNFSDWESLLGNCMAVTDIPCVIFWKELLQRYPDAKVVLTIRDNPEQWYDSYKATIVPWFHRTYEGNSAFSNLLMKMSIFKTPMERMGEMIDKQYLTPKLTEGGTGYYEWYVNKIQEVVPPERLLVFNVKQGWEPLVEFLGSRKQPKTEFPKVNQRDTFPGMFADAPVALGS